MNVINKLAEALEEELFAMRQLADDAEELARSAGIAVERLSSAVRLAEAENLRRERAINKYNAEIERLKKFGARAIKVASAPIPFSTPVPPIVRMVVRGRTEIESAAALAAKPIGNIQTMCGIYFLMDGNTIVYVGQSIDVASRVLSHIRDPQKRFDRACWFPVAKEELNDVEEALIALLKPEQNRRGINNHGDDSLALFYGACHESKES